MTHILFNFLLFPLQYLEEKLRGFKRTQNTLKEEKVMGRKFCENELL